MITSQEIHHGTLLHSRILLFSMEDTALRLAKSHDMIWFHMYMIFVFIIIIMFTSIETRLTDSFLSHFIIKGYIGEFEIIDDHRSNKIVVELNGRLNKCGVISPRFDVGYDEIEKWVVNLLPSRQFGHILISTTYGIMTHEEARRKKTGGKILGFFYWRGRPWLLK